MNTGESEIILNLAQRLEFAIESKFKEEAHVIIKEVVDELRFLTKNNATVLNQMQAQLYAALNALEDIKKITDEILD